MPNKSRPVDGFVELNRVNLKEELVGFCDNRNIKKDKEDTSILCMS